MSREQDDFFNAAKWGVWVWIALSALPIVAVLLCCFGCFGMGIVGSATEGVQ